MLDRMVYFLGRFYGYLLTRANKHRFVTLTRFVLANNLKEVKPVPFPESEFFKQSPSVFSGECFGYILTCGFNEDLTDARVVVRAKCGCMTMLDVPMDDVTEESLEMAAKSLMDAVSDGHKWVHEATSLSDEPVTGSASVH